MEEPEADRTYPWQVVVAAEAVDPSYPSLVAVVGAGRNSSQVCYQRVEQEVGPGHLRRPKQTGYLDRRQVRLLARRLGRRPQIGRKDCS